jgi:orotidine-5'-phosphate decarboxylase
LISFKWLKMPNVLKQAIFKYNDMNHDQLFGKILEKRSFLCIGLDSDIEKIPVSLERAEDPVFEFNRKIIDSTHMFAVAYKLNLAFYECNGVKGWRSLELSLSYIKENYPDILVIADAKRGDIGNTSRMYARAFFEKMDFDAVTVAPYMGEDSITPFLGFSDKWAIILALTSNMGADDFQYHNETGTKLFEKVLKVSQNWGSIDNMMFVAGATRASMLKEIREIVPEHFLLIPGIGAQGGNLEEVVKYGMNSKCGLIVNSSRGIIFADNSEEFGRIAGEKAKDLQMEMERYLTQYRLI